MPKISEAYVQKAKRYIDALCGVKPNRRTGSPGNRAATDFFIETLKPFDYALDTAPFPCLDFRDGGARLTCKGQPFEVFVSPYSLGCDAAAGLVTAADVCELEECDCRGQILLMRGDLCAEQLMPKNFVFYNPDHHKLIYSLLEEKQPAAIVTATSRNPDLVGALYPFPLIEDGDFDIPSVYCTEDTGKDIAARAGEVFHLESKAERIPSAAANVLACKNPRAGNKITVCAHIDAYGNSPGASDNATGAAVLLLLAEMLDGYKGDAGIELIALNGEDNYSAAGQMDYLRRYGEETGRISLAVNIDDVGFIHGRSAFSFYGCPEALQNRAAAVFGRYPSLAAGEPWYQGDHMIFVQKGVPALAFTSENVAELMGGYTHTGRDTPDIVDCRKVAEVAEALGELIQAL